MLQSTHSLWRISMTDRLSAILSPEQKKKIRSNICRLIDSWQYFEQWKTYSEVRWIHFDWKGAFGRFLHRPMSVQLRHAHRCRRDFSLTRCIDSRANRFVSVAHFSVTQQRMTRDSDEIVLCCLSIDPQRHHRGNGARERTIYIKMLSTPLWSNTSP